LFFSYLIFTGSPRFPDILLKLFNELPDNKWFICLKHPVYFTECCNEQWCLHQLRQRTDVVFVITRWMPLDIRCRALRLVVVCQNPPFCPFSTNFPEMRRHTLLTVEIENGWNRKFHCCRHYVSMTTTNLFDKRWIISRWFIAARMWMLLIIFCALISEHYNTISWLC